MESSQSGLTHVSPTQKGYAMNIEQTLTHRWGRVKDLFNELNPKDFWVDVNTYMRELTKCLIEDILEEEISQYMRRRLQCLPARYIHP